MLAYALLLFCEVVSEFWAKLNVIILFYKFLTLCVIQSILMIKINLLLVSLFFIVLQAEAYSGGTGNCNINANYSPDFDVMARRLNYNSGDYSLVLNTSFYTFNSAIEITINGPTFTGIVFTVVDGNDNNIGSFVADQAYIRNCTGLGSSGSAIVTHISNTNLENMSTYTLYWLPPANYSGELYVEGYILKGVRGGSNQEFYRFVKEDLNPVSMKARDVFVSSFE